VFVAFTVYVVVVVGLAAIAAADVELNPVDGDQLNVSLVIPFTLILSNNQ